MISLLGLEQQKSIIYKALSKKKEEEEKQLNGHVKPQKQQKRIKFHSPTHTHTPHQYTQIHTLTQVMRMQNLIQF